MSSLREKYTRAAALVVSDYRYAKYLQQNPSDDERVGGGGGITATTTTTTTAGSPPTSEHHDNVTHYPFTANAATSSSATIVASSSFNAVPKLKSDSALTAVFSNNDNGAVGGWISTKKSNADIRKCAAMAKEARRRLLADTDEESSNGMKTKYMFAPPNRLKIFKTIYDGTTTTSNNVFSNSNNDNGAVGGWISTKKSNADIRKCAAMAKEARISTYMSTSNYSVVPNRGTSFLEEAAIGPSNMRGRLPYYKTFDEKKVTAKGPTIANTLSKVTLLPIMDSVMNNYRNSENVVCLPPKKDEELYAIGCEESDDGASKKKRKKEEDNMDNDLSEPRKVKKTARNKREDETTAGDDDDEASEYQPNHVELTVEKKKEKKKEKKIIKEEVLDKLVALGDEMKNVFTSSRWKKLFPTMTNKSSLSRQLFFDKSNEATSWREKVVQMARGMLGIGRILQAPGVAVGDVTAAYSKSAMHNANTSTFTRTILLPEDHLGEAIFILEELRANRNPVIPEYLVPFFSLGNHDKALGLVLSDLDTATSKFVEEYESEDAIEFATSVKNRFKLNQFPSYKKYRNTTLEFVTAKTIYAWSKLSTEDLHVKVHEFLKEKIPRLKMGSIEYRYAFWQRIISILKTGSMVDDLVILLKNGFGAVFPVEGGSAFFTMGTSEMLDLGKMSRNFCPGMSNKYHGDRMNNKHPLQFNKYYLMSPTLCITINTNANGQNNSFNDEDGIYSAKKITIGGKMRIIRRLYERIKCSKPSEAYPNRSEQIIYEYSFSDGRSRSIAHHQYMLIYAFACGVGKKSFTDLFEKLRSDIAESNMITSKINPEEWTDGDHCLHRLKLISNSIWFCYPVDHITNQCCATSRQKTKDWNYLLTIRPYVDGN